MGAGSPIRKVVSPGGKGGVQEDPMANDEFVNNYILSNGLGGKGGYTSPGYDQRMATYEAQRQALDAQAAQNLALRQNYSSGYMDNFQPFTGSYAYQQPSYYQSPQQFYSPPQQYYSPYMNQFQMAGSQFYQQPYSYQPSPYYQQGPFMQPGGREQYFAQRNMGGYGKGGFY